MADNSIVNALKGVSSAEAIPFGAATMPEGSVPYLSAMLSGLLNIPKHLIDSAKTATPGLRREDVTDIPGTSQPNDPLYHAAADTAMALGGIGAPAAEVGAAGIFGGKLAKTADIEKLIKANNYQSKGATPSQIWGETGWFKSPTDHKWKFEISDDASKMIGHSLDYTKDGNMIKGRTYAMFEHPELYEAYPQLKNKTMYNTVFHNPPNKIGRGSFDPLTFTSEVEAANLGGARSVGLHELQHGVQTIENFAPGGNPSSMAYLKEKKPQKLPMFEQKSDPNDLYHRLAGEVESRNVQDRMDFHPVHRQMMPPWSTHDTLFRDQLVFDPRTELVRALRNGK